jgi:hypothetical protein
MQKHIVAIGSIALDTPTTTFNRIITNRKSKMSNGLLMADVESEHGIRHPAAPAITGR